MSRLMARQFDHSRHASPSVEGGDLGALVRPLGHDPGKRRPIPFPLLLFPNFISGREDFVPGASRPCSSMAGTTMARFWLRPCRAVPKHPPGRVVWRILLLLACLL